MSLIWPAGPSTCCCRAISRSVQAQRRLKSTASSVSAADELRQLMRRVAQPVAVITANLRDPDKLDEPDHGATVSSFVSIALAPQPVVAFSLRLPSRLASYLEEVSKPKSLSQDPTATFRIHVLSQQQETLAKAFARPPPPIRASKPADNVPIFAPFSKDLFTSLRATSVGYLDAYVVGRLHLSEPLGQSVALEDALPSKSNAGHAADPNSATSQLFLAKVLHAGLGNSDAPPLLYHLQQYKSTAP